MQEQTKTGNRSELSATAFPDSKPHYHLLDGLRGVAALLVLWHHVFEGYAFAGNKPVIDFANHGYLAVDFFFLLSGFVIGYAYDNRWNRSLSLGGFVRRRLIRLHPMVVMGAVIGLVCFALQGFQQWDGTPSSSGRVALSFLFALFMIPVLPGSYGEVRGNGEMYPLNGPCWSLFFEYIGNLLYALFIRRLSTRMLAVLTFAQGVLLVWFVTADVSGYGNLGVGWTIDPMNTLGGSLRMLFPFTLDLLLSRVFKPCRVRGAFWLCSLVLVALFHVPFLPGRDSICLNGVFEAACIVFVFPALVWLGASGVTTDRHSTRICNFLGDISFPLYIVHYPLMYVFYGWLIQTKQYTFSETWPVALLVCGASVVLAWLCLEFYDRPVRRWLSARFRK